MLKILIVGHGFVGQAVDYGFSHPEVEKTIVDPKYGSSLDSVDVRSFDCVFVCVPTPMGNGGIIDSNIINSTLLSLNRSKLVVIKSTVTPDIVKSWPQQVVYNPEFLTEKSANEQFIDPQFHILGGEKSATERVEHIYKTYSLCNPCPFLHMTKEEASFVKYTINCFLATKVTFFNQLYDIVSNSGANFSTIINAVGMDKRIGHSHAKVPGFDGKQGFGGACFPKDTTAFTWFARDNYKKRLTLLEECININNEYRSQYNLDSREMEQNVYYGQAKKEQ